MLMRIVCGIVAVVAQSRKLFGFLLFLLQYLSACFSVFTKNGNKHVVACHGLANAHRIVEQFAHHLVPVFHGFNCQQVILGNAATVAC